MYCLHGRCLPEVDDNIDSLMHPDEPPTKEHENHELFKQEQDEQLLLWMQRWLLSLLSVSSNPYTSPYTGLLIHVHTVHTLYM